MEQLTAQQVLKKYWNHDGFRPLQEDIINSVLAGNDTLGLLPTGGGKSVCFQVPALMQEGVCIVVTPLIALMKDQVENLQKKDIVAAAIFSGMSYREIDTVLDNCRFGKTKFLYVSPERLQTELFIERFRRMKVSFIVVDEAHCISQWGYDFRPSYMEIAKIREYQPTAPILALTATATKSVVADIQQKLAFKKENVFAKSFERKNLIYYAVEESNKYERLIQICKKIKGTGIVYVRNRKRTQEVAEFLKRQGISADFYHAGIEQQDRDKKQQSWKDNHTRIIVCTNAFGMGIDKPNVRFVVHIDLPESIEAYYQEAGRGGRDEQWAHAIILYDNADLLKLIDDFESSYPTVDNIKLIYQAIANYLQLATGAGEFLTLDFDIEKFITTYKLQPRLVMACIQILEQEGYILFNKEKLLPTRLKILLSNIEYYNFELKNPAHENIMKTILRSYGNAFEAHAKVNEYDLARNAKKPIEKVIETLTLLHKLKVIEYLPQTKTTQITLTHQRVDSKSLYINPETYLWRKKQSSSRITAMVQYTSNNEVCRSMQLLAYFSEEGNDCGYCDVCLDKKKKHLSQSDFEQIKKDILEFLKMQPHTLEFIIEHISGFSKEKVNETITILMDENVLKYDEQLRLKICS